MMEWLKRALVIPLLGMAACMADGNEAPSEPQGGTGPEGTAAAPTVTTVVDGLEHPWGMAFLPGDEGILVTERPGRLRLIRGGQLVAEPIAGVPAVRATGQGGLLDVALHPDFASNRLVYLTYSKPGEGGATTAVARGRLDGHALVGTSDIFVADAWASGGQHFGSRMVFDRDGYLFVTVGDRGADARAQDLGSHTATTLRLHDDGRAPQDNPFVGRAEVRDEIYTYGNRNAQGMAVHPETGEIWQNEHGPRGGDELNRIVAGVNYGWADVSFGNQYTGGSIPDPQPGDGTELPVTHWTPALAPSGLAIYTGDAFPHWQGDFFLGSLAEEHLLRIRLDGTQVVEEEALLEERGDRIRDVRTGPDGLIYVLVDASSAPLLRLEPSRD